MRCACLLRVVGTRGAHRPWGDMWSPRAVHSRLVQREACASVLSAAATVAGPRFRLKNFYDRLDSLVMRTDSSCVEIGDSRVFVFAIIFGLHFQREAAWQGGKRGRCCGVTAPSAWRTGTA